MAFSAAIATLMVALCLGPALPRRPFEAPAVRKLGDISYGIYLSHYPIVVLVFAAIDLDRLSDLSRFLVLTAIVVPTAILYGYLSARFLEQPIRRWARKYGRRDDA
jgi:peptidoglycan/LPS O-acetylase OafA/YrhL